MTNEIYSELNEAQKIIYTRSMIGRAFPDFDHGQICTIYSVGKNSIVKRKNGIEEKYPAEDIKVAYLKFIQREVPFFSYLGPNYRGPIPWPYQSNTYILLKGWNYAYQGSHKTPEARMQQLWANSFSNLKSIESVKSVLDNLNDDDPDDEGLEDTEKALGHIMTPYKYCSCQAFQKQLKNLDQFKEEFYENYQPMCKHLHWYDNFKLFQRKRNELAEDLGGRPPMNVVIWFYVPPAKQYQKGTFKLWWTTKGLYSDICNWKQINSLSQWDAWNYFDRMLEKGFIPYEASTVPKLKSILCGKS